MNIGEVNEILEGVRVYEGQKGYAVGKHPCRDYIRKAIFVGISIYRVQRECEEKYDETGDTKYKITSKALRTYKNDPQVKESIQVEYQNKRRLERNKEKQKEERNPGIDMCITVIKLANKFLEEAKEHNFEGLTESQWKLIDRGIAASKALPVLKKAEPEIFDYEEVALLDPESERLVKEIADDVAKQIGGTESVEAKS